mmetsp:Transcript_50536/g.156370  ORF Transcript_50536/g.156370 Transcript_50536/m.156370 type:complete len:206 (+) Transcript_50536:573-1190(+)
MGGLRGGVWSVHWCHQWEVEEVLGRLACRARRRVLHWCHVQKIWSLCIFNLRWCRFAGPTVRDRASRGVAATSSFLRHGRGLSSFSATEGRHDLRGLLAALRHLCEVLHEPLGGVHDDLCGVPPHATLLMQVFKGIESTKSWLPIQISTCKAQLLVECIGNRARVKHVALRPEHIEVHCIWYHTCCRVVLAEVSDDLRGLRPLPR